jgi:hypothetical protein
MPERTIPILPCRALPPVLDFSTALGFERADVVRRLGDEEATASALARAAALGLTEAERDQGRDALTRLEDLRGSPRP